ncbi:MBL fold metallo-hydrolase [Ramlibacter algicola]|uniref:MBL fold metallo-hydrolase n=1 Tax=Ramlibacter algicola TaxID=2795217 RepID=A0A934Q3J9_9BURK|nr:MBL fold metallo-hydrolase [Ramlibacter algicola]MBK0393917.1 MBL fold metallo-hydrolase [Ramlibacter algicola]
MRLTFLGGAGTVTGSRFLLEHGGRRLLVDCGLFQGLKQLRLRNWAPFPVPPASIDAVVLTHAHIDHSGYIPALAKHGFRGPVFCTPATRDLAGLLLPDSGHLQEEDAAYANRHGLSKHRPALPLYTEANARASLSLLEAVRFDEPFTPVPGLKARFVRAGHILGAASVHLAWDGGSVLFSGDLGRNADPLMEPPDAPPAADHVVMESTYGDRDHEDVQPEDELARVVVRTAARGGMVVIPAFAVGRAQLVLHLLARLKGQGRIPPDLPVFLDSPMATDVTQLYAKYRDEHRLDNAACEAMCHQARFVQSVEESMSLRELRMPSVIVSASGMATGGRVVHHLEAFLPDRRNTVLLVGYQAAGTRGATLAAGLRDVKIHGQHVPVRAEIASLGAMSAHADRGELLHWLDRLPHAPRSVHLVHGEPVAADSLRRDIEERHPGWSCIVAEQLATVNF